MPICGAANPRPRWTVRRRLELWQKIPEIGLHPQAHRVHAADRSGIDIDPVLREEHARHGEDGRLLHGLTDTGDQAVRPHIPEAVGQRDEQGEHGIEQDADDHYRLAAPPVQQISDEDPGQAEPEREDGGQEATLRQAEMELGVGGLDESRKWSGDNDM
jgi:hypothetical protein